MFFPAQPKIYLPSYFCRLGLFLSLSKNLYLKYRKGNRMKWNGINRTCKTFVALHSMIRNGKTMCFITLRAKKGFLGWENFIFRLFSYFLLTNPRVLLNTLHTQTLCHCFLVVPLCFAH